MAFASIGSFIAFTPSHNIKDWQSFFVRVIIALGDALETLIRQKQAGMAQVVERRIGSAEVPGPTPGASFQTPCISRSFFICFLSLLPLPLPIPVQTIRSFSDSVIQKTHFHL